MDLQLYATFVVATAILIAIPGPIVTLVIANGISYGVRRGLLTVSGGTLATAVLLVIGGVGLTSVLAVLADWFEWLRWLGVAYLLWLGVQAWRARPVSLEDQATAPMPRRSLFWQGFFVGITNPKTVLFYVAFFPQFVDPGRPLGFQIVVLSLTFLALAVLLDGTYAVLAGRLRGWFQGHRRARIRNRITGSLLIGAGLGLALARRS